MFLSDEDCELLLGSFREGSRSYSMLIKLIQGPIEVCRLGSGYKATSIGGLNTSLKQKKLPFRVFSMSKDTPWANRDLYLRRIDS